MIRRKTNRRHMTGDHHGRTARRATLLVTATDEILGTHTRKRLAVITELACLSFVRAWRTDVDSWCEKLTNLPVLADLTDSGEPAVDLPRR